MIQLKLCTDVTDEIIFNTFKEGFSDYYIQKEMTQDFFIDHFLGPEGNSKALSLVAFEEDKPVGILLAGIRVLDGIRTLRCGGMAVIPAARKKGIAYKLLQEHERMGKESDVHQLFLEVLTINEAAFKLYKAFGYEKVYDLTYRSFKPEADWLLMRPEDLLSDENAYYSIQKITLMDLEPLRNNDDSHLPWQGSMDYVTMMPAEIYGVFKNGQLIAGLIGSKTQLFYIYVLPSYRLQGVGKALLMTYIKDTEIETCSFVYTNNARLHTFANYLGMDTGKFAQYECYKWLG